MKIYTFKILLLLLLVLSQIDVQAQTKISGNVTDVETSEPLAGVNIMVKGTTQGTTTDANGSYSLTVPSLSDTLVFSFIGYQTKEIPINGRKQVDVSLQSQAISGEELVVVGYGEAKKEEITSSISSVSGEELSSSTVDNVAQTLQGKVSGVQIIPGSGKPGANSTILIRGITSNQGTNPLIVVDGVPQSVSFDLNSLNPQTISSIDILKDASAAAIYGARASNGVILVSTKRGSAGDAAISVDASYGVQNIPEFEVAKAREYALVQNQRFLNDNPSVNIPFPQADSYGKGTDWWDESVQTLAPTAEINIGLSGGSKDITYFASVGYFREEALALKGSWERVSARFNFDYSITDNLTLKQGFNPKLILSKDTPSPFSNALRIDPLTSVYLPESQRQGKNQFSIFQRSKNTQIWNPVASARRSFGNNRKFEFNSNTRLQYNPIPNLEIQTQLGLTINYYRRDDFNPQFFLDPLEQNKRSQVWRSYASNIDYVSNNTVTYSKDIADHSFSILGGVTLESYRYNALSGSRDEVPGIAKKLRYISLATGESINVSDGESLTRLFSLLSRLRYNYDEKYFLTASIRRDASSNFPEENRFAVFPSISAAWDISQENFFSNVPYVNSFRLKAGYGEVGNQNIPGSASLFEVATGDYIFGVDESRVVTAYLSRFGNNNLKWETVKDINVGIEIAMFDNKLNLSVERYRRESIDNLYATVYPSYAGSPSSVFQNVGSFRSNGWDASVNYNDQAGDFSYNLGVNISTNESKALSITPGKDQLLAFRSFGGRNAKITRVGETVGLFYGLKTDGLFRDADAVTDYINDQGRPIQPNASAGDIKYVDINDDGVIDENDQTIIGNPFPDFTGGINVNLGYKRWSLGMQLYGNYGNDVYNTTKAYLTSGDKGLNIMQGLLDEVWTPDNKGASIPRLSVTDPNGNFDKPSEYFIEDGSYLRMKNIRLGYDIPLEKIQMLQIYISAQNLFTLTRYSGLDPEVQSSGGIINTYGIDTARYPSPRTFLIGLNMKF